MTTETDELPPPPIKLRRDDDLAIEFNNTSMTDVIFILLIFFISLSQVRASRVDVDLPTVSKAEAPAPADDGKRVQIELAKDNAIFIDGEKVEAAALPAKLEALKAGGTDPRVRIRSDQKSSSGSLVAVIAALADAGLQKVEFEVESAPGAR